ncbi:MAG TPA: hypothetical protein VJ436_09585 [Anaerolineales bacterium]|nr:hypothetical protein [Anaerolineales bacterium]
MDFRDLYRRHQTGLEDFWGRRENRASHVVEFRLFGRRARLSSNQPSVLAAAESLQPLYSQAPDTDEPPFSVQLIVDQPSSDPGPVPGDPGLFLQYTGSDDWLNMHLGKWGNCFAHLAEGWAVAVLAPQLADQPEQVARSLLNTVFTNFFTRHGFAMLHATCLVRENRAVLLMAPHGIGKSTTALRLILQGYAALSDSMIYLTQRGGQLQLTGFPVGRIKLREDMLAEFPQVSAFLTPEVVRGETKYSLDLRRFAPGLVCDRAVFPEHIDLCLVQRDHSGKTRLARASPESLYPAIMENSLHYDTQALWERNLAQIERLVEKARCHRLEIGDDAQEILAAVAGFWDLP